MLTNLCCRFFLCPAGVLPLPAGASGNFSWQLLSGTPSPNFAILTKPNNKYWIVAANSFLPGFTYTIRLFANIRGDNRFGFADVQLRVNKPPVSGGCNLNASSARALEDVVEALCVSWAGEIHPPVLNRGVVVDSRHCI